MSLNLNIKQMPLPVTESHSDHTWNIALNDYSAYTDIRLIVDVYKNPYSNEMGGDQQAGKIARLIIPSNLYGNCIFNVEQIIRNIVKANPRNLTMIPGGNPGQATVNPYFVRTTDDNLYTQYLETSQATIVNDRYTSVSYSNGFNGDFEGFENIYQVNEYRLIFVVQYTSGTTTVQVIDETNWNVYNGYNDGDPIDPTDATTQPYGVMTWPGVQDNKRYGLDYYYSANNLTGQYNYMNAKALDWEMSLSNPGEFMATFGNQTIPMTAFDSPVYETRWRTHYYKCPIVIGFMYGGNPLYNNTSQVASITFLQKTTNNSVINYDIAQNILVDYTNRGGSQANPPYSYLSQRIAYGIFKQNPVIYTNSDVAIFFSNADCGIDPDTNGVSEIVQYKMVGDECFNNPVSFLFMNRHGVWDTYTFTKKSQKTYEAERKTYNSNKTLNTPWWNRQSYDSYETVYYGVANEMLTVDSNYVIQNDALIIEELLLSPYVYIIEDNWTPQNNQPNIYPYLIPCTVQNKEVKVFQQKYQRLFQYTLELKQTPYRQFELAI